MAEISAPPRRNISRMPLWIRSELGRADFYGVTAEVVRDNRLHTVCAEAKCPNRGECWSRGTATFMLLGDTCTRACAFCAVKTGRPQWFDAEEPQRVAQAALALKLKYVVVTSVNRDDMEDGGAGVFAATVKALRATLPECGIELLTPDFRACQDDAISTIGATLRALSRGARTDLVWGHNVETVPRLYRSARKGSDFQRSLRLLRKAAKLHGVETKSALMLGLGETRAEVLAVLKVLRDNAVSRVSLGQYLRPSLAHLAVEGYVEPDEFARYEDDARALGFTWVKAGPMVRSSYFAEQHNV